MEIIGFFIFLVVSHVGVMQVFRFTTFHATFWKALPFLVGYAVLVGWCLYLFELHEFFLWQVVLGSVWLFLVGRKQAKLGEALMQSLPDDAHAVRVAARSVENTRQYYSYSAFIYVLVFSITYLWLYNN